MTIDSQDFEDLQAQNICTDCIGEACLSALVENEPEDECTYCGEERPCITMKEFADQIEAAIETHFARTPDEPNGYELMMLKDKELDYDWEREGQQTVYAIMDAAEIRENIAQDAQAILEYRHEDWDSAVAGMECEFSSDAHYEEIMPNDGGWHEQWDEFERLIKTEARFFSRTAATHLGTLFDKIDELRTRAGRSIVIDAGPGTDIESLYRGRVFQSEPPLIKAMKRPDQELAAPPAWAAGAGRMNARGISIFYGATTPEIVLAEVRPPVGSKVALAHFEIIRPLRLLNLAALAEIHERGSIFDPDYAYRLGRMTFLRTLSFIMARPVMPDDQEMEYLPTQAIADYLSTEGQVPLDGIVFPSVQVGGNGLNVALFHKASRAEQLDISEGTEINARTYSTYEDGPEPDYSVTEEVPPDPSEEEEDDAPAPTPFDLAMQDWDEVLDIDSRECTLRIDPASLQVHEVSAVQINTRRYSVRRHRFEKREPPF